MGTRCPSGKKVWDGNEDVLNMGQEIKAKGMDTFEEERSRPKAQEGRVAFLCVTAVTSKS